MILSCHARLLIHAAAFPNIGSPSFLERGADGKEKEKVIICDLILARLVSHCAESSVTKHCYNCPIYRGGH